MLLEILIVFEIIAFVFLALSIIPFAGNKENKLETPLLNKVLFIMVATILFFMLAMNSVQYQYNYCYVNATSLNYATNTSLSTATCASYQIASYDLSYLNWGMAVVSVILAVIIILFVFSFNKERRNIE
jgi:peptidoglycan/LPS O-acetylase OafA/YrhL